MNTFVWTLIGVLTVLCLGFVAWSLHTRGRLNWDTLKWILIGVMVAAATVAVINFREAIPFKWITIGIVTMIIVGVVIWQLESVKKQDSKFTMRFLAGLCGVFYLAWLIGQHNELGAVAFAAYLYSIENIAIGASALGVGLFLWLISDGTRKVPVNKILAGLVAAAVGYMLYLHFCPGLISKLSKMTPEQLGTAIDTRIHNHPLIFSVLALAVVGWLLWKLIKVESFRKFVMFTAQIGAIIALFFFLKSWLGSNHSVGSTTAFVDTEVIRPVPVNPTDRNIVTDIVLVAGITYDVYYPLKPGYGWDMVFATDEHNEFVPVPLDISANDRTRTITPGMTWQQQKEVIDELGNIGKACIKTRIQPGSCKPNSVFKMVILSKNTEL